MEAVSLRQPGHAPSLTGIRGIAAVVVVIYHYVDVPLFLSGAAVRETFAGYLAVDLFFVLSGFLMAWNYGRFFADGFAWRSYGTFLERRFARIYPLYIVMTLIAFIMARAGVGGPFYLRTLATNILLIQQLGPGMWDPHLGVSIAGPAWSISTEFGAYLLFPPLLYLTVTARRSVAVAVGVAGIAALVLIATVPWSWKPQGIAGEGPLNVWNGADLWAFLRCVADFSLGLLAYRVASRTRGTTLGGDGFGFAIALVTVALWATFGADVATVLAFVVLIAHLSFERSRVARLLGTRPCLFLGDISYALYLWHMLLLSLLVLVPNPLSRFFTAHLGYGASAVLAFAAALVLSWLSFRLIERPARRQVRQFFDGRRPRSIHLEPSAP